MRRSLILAAALLAASAAPSLADPGNQSCEDAGLSLNSVTALRPFADGSVKLFTIDRDEPAAAPVGVAITIDRGNDLSDAESFCRFVDGLSDADIAAAKASYDGEKALLTVRIPVRHHDQAKDVFIKGTLTLVIDKAAMEQKDLVKETLK